MSSLILFLTDDASQHIVTMAVDELNAHSYSALWQDEERAFLDLYGLVVQVRHIDAQVLCEVGASHLCFRLAPHLPSQSDSAYENDQVKALITQVKDVLYERSLREEPPSPRNKAA
jgi:hypothetical protein